MRVIVVAGKTLLISLACSVFVLAVALTLVRAGSFERTPFIAGYKPLVVQSGSMEPAIGTGSVVLVQPAAPGEIRVGDPITFRAGGPKGSESERPLLITHRVTEVLNESGRLSFKTKGDANKSQDPNAVAAADVLGRVSVSMPYAGYIGVFARTRTGFLALIVVPGLLIIATEIRSLLANVTRVGKEVDVDHAQ